MYRQKTDPLEEKMFSIKELRDCQRRLIITLLSKAEWKDLGTESRAKINASVSYWLEQIYKPKSLVKKEILRSIEEKYQRTLIK